MSKENVINDRLIEQIKYSYDNNDINAHAKLYAMDHNKSSWNRDISIDMQKDIGRVLGHIASEAIVKNPTDETLKQVGDKLGHFLSSMEHVAIYMTLFTIRKNILENAPSLTNVDNNIKMLNNDRLTLLAQAIDKHTGETKRRSVIAGMTDFDDLDKKEENERQDKLINEKLRQLGVLPQDLEKKLNALQKSYFEVTEMSRQLGVEAPELSGDRPKVNVEEFRRRLLGSNEDTNNNKPKQ